MTKRRDCRKLGEHKNPWGGVAGVESELVPGNETGGVMSAYFGGIRPLISGETAPPCFGSNRPPVSVISPTRGGRGKRRLILHRHLHSCDDGQGGWDAAGEIGHATHQGSLTAAR